MLRWIEAPGPHESSINQNGVGHPRTIGIPLINLFVDYRDFMLQSRCYGFMPQWVSDTILDNASAIDRHTNRQQGDLKCADEVTSAGND
jgi:hypothetical protein